MSGNRFELTLRVVNWNGGNLGKPEAKKKEAFQAVNEAHKI